ncbi:septation ring formation regulator EzrA, partial [Staphylococcus saprophyticus]|uniref:septation ring formation regulator EzrA n=1 Tax=Staphylococcus saprophyticus TaxID=29385 RepID=UPI00298204C3
MKSLNDEMNYLKRDMDEIGDLIKEGEKELGGELEEIKYGCRELKVEPYHLHHLKIHTTLQTLKTHLTFLHPMITT